MAVDNMLVIERGIPWYLSDKSALEWWESGILSLLGKQRCLN